MGAAVNLPDAIKSCFSKYITFSGRASRSEYWYWVLFTFLTGQILSIADKYLLDVHIFGGSSIFLLLTLLPGISVSVRRVHDINYSGWLFITVPLGASFFSVLLLILVGILHIATTQFAFVGIASLPVGIWIGLFFVWNIRKGTVGDNRFGPDPLAVQEPMGNI